MLTPHPETRRQKPPFACQAQSLRSEDASVQGKPVSGQDNGFYGTIANQTWRRNING